MKKLAVVFSLMMLMASCNQVKIAYVDVEEILKEYDGAKKAEEDMKAKSQAISQQLDQLAQPLQEKIQEYQKNKDNLSASARQKKESELMQEQQMFQQQQQMAQQQVQAEGQRMFEEMNSDIESFLEDYGKSKGYTYILGSSMQTKSVLYGEASLNITDAVIDALNESYASDTAEDSGSTEAMEIPEVPEPAEEPAPVN
ncbi:OmpH family outer membrane protein [Lutimonas zeaxanthinifaciens]|uniref:OmpH family outer membrane protein n=1 Tax=Lutimonas zeaxanthinifaciens TaxID=3060215 RepID=UPI00265D3023|nr:OmpH family outer membrane protein [Lutimonas sp. YSD2104]WKK66040.1 OmpH family outer membrane protein [Lutimonas sp. YSD2104]